MFMQMSLYFTTHSNHHHITIFNCLQIAHIIIIINITSKSIFDWVHIPNAHFFQFLSNQILRWFGHSPVVFTAFYALMANTYESLFSTKTDLIYFEM